jgi:hypothetical protein
MVAVTSGCSWRWQHCSRPRHCVMENRQTRRAVGPASAVHTPAFLPAPTPSAWLKLGEIWNTYPVQRIVIEASAEWEAREKVAEVSPEVHQPNPWLDPLLTTCEEIEAPDALAAAPRRAALGLGREPELPLYA